ncbi:ABC transporter substrate-binding protein [Gordonia humi]|uniref:Iron complex transport system substrate-binding protein n=1 Tax=Gordonia humi TaxID=686429 RepID=A0A840ETE8_9ACTN|nr:ABC transporter substrate-binding protein [Gordonia humi]MBB4134841.1 iron complex transport system substrate-binding protein [Gordonia humi]
MDKNRVRAVVSIVVALLTALVACGSPEPAADTGTGGGRSIVSLSPTATEMLYAVGAGPQVVAVDDQSDYPADAPRTDLSGYTPNLEAILAHDPDLVVLSDDDNNVVAGLKRVGVEVLQVPAAKNLDETYAEIQKVGDATGHADQARRLTASMRTDIDAIVADTGPATPGLSYYLELDNTFYSVTDATYVGQILAMFGLRSIATGANDYPQLSAEYIIEQDPDLILLTDAKCCSVTKESVARRAGWGDLRAVTQERVFALDDDVASRWGPRVVDLVRRVAEIVTGVRDQRAP